MKVPFKGIERLSVSGNIWIVRPWCSRSLEKIQDGCREGASSECFSDGEAVEESAP